MAERLKNQLLLVGKEDMIILFPHTKSHLCLEAQKRSVPHDSLQVMSTEGNYYK